MGNYEENQYIDSVYDFKGLWDVDSRCGLKIVRTKDKVIVIATELYQDNPGTSITSFCDKLAGKIIDDYSVDPDKLVFIEHSPGKTDKIEHYKETFDIVHFTWDGSQFSNPDWTRIPREEVDAMLNEQS